MTPERDPETVEMFVAESLEALGRAEQLLLAGERGQTSAESLATLFRDVHTLKGTSAFLGYSRTLALAHAGEDLLARLRSGALPAGPGQFALLLELNDALRRMVERIRDGGEELELDVEPLVARLRSQGEVPTPAPVAPPEPEAPVRTPEKDGSVRVSVAVLDRLMNLMGELVLVRNQLLRGRDGQGQPAFQRLGLITSDLQAAIMKTRMQPVSRVLEQVPRQVRDLSRATGKRVGAQVEGTHTELDKALIEAVKDPVLHMVRNAVDHGIEPTAERVARGKPPAGSITVRAAHQGGTVVLEVEDDGRGMDPEELRRHAVQKGLLSAADARRLTDREALELVFQPGFSTARDVTEISGRGVGMDVVRTHVERAGGQVELESTPGKGTTVRLRMPLTLAIIPGLLVGSAGQRFVIPQVNLLELLHLDEEELRASVESVRGAQILRLRGEVLPLVGLTDVLGLPSRQGGDRTVVVLGVGARRYGLLVEELHDSEEIVVKPLHAQLQRIPCYSGVTVLGDGGVALILDLAGVATMAGIEMTAKARPAAEPTSPARPEERLLLFRAGAGQLCAVPLAQVTRIEQVEAARIERVGAAEMLQYREGLVSVVRPESLLPLGAALPRTLQQLLVFDFGQPVGMAVDEIVDAVEVVVEEGQRRPLPGALPAEMAVVAGRTTLLLDAPALVRRLVPGFAGAPREPDVSGRRSERVRVG